ncbi:MAG: hypothetical protein LBR47_07390 [Spirochaetaceae bacterium]|jgi:hypothetical protein|nr:hypothetical protein [Spirochaetaceae bacterium]
MSDLRDEFKRWMGRQQKDNGKPYSPNTITTYCQALKNAADKLSHLPIDIRKNLFEYTDIHEFLKAEAVIKQQPDFDEIDTAAGHKSFSAGMNMYEKFLQERNKKEVNRWIPLIRMN